MPRTRQKVQTPTGQPYGAAGASQAAQKAVPLPLNPASTPMAPQAAPTPQADPIAAAQAMQPPVGLLTQPSDNPGALPTHGLPIGPGAGPEALPDPASYIPAPDDSWVLAKWLPTLEDSGRGPDGSSEVRQMVRRIRGSLPSDVTQQALVQQTQGATYGGR